MSKGSNPRKRRSPARKPSALRVNRDLLVAELARIKTEIGARERAEEYSEKVAEAWSVADLDKDLVAGLTPFLGVLGKMIGYVAVAEENGGKLDNSTVREALRFAFQEEGSKLVREAGRRAGEKMLAEQGPVSDLEAKEDGDERREE